MTVLEAAWSVLVAAHHAAHRHATAGAAVNAEEADVRRPLDVPAALEVLEHPSRMVVRGGVLGPPVGPASGACSKVVAAIL